MRDRLIAGEALSLPQIKQEFPNADDHVVRDAARALSEEGWRIIRERRKTDPARPSTTIFEFRVEAKDTVDDGAKTVKERVRRRLLAGEELCQVELNREYGTRSHTLRDVIKQLEGEGVTVAQDRRLMNPGGHPPIFNVYCKVATGSKKPRVTDPRSATARIRAAFEDGDKLTATTAAKRFKCSKANFHLVVASMRKDGVEFDVTSSTRKVNGRQVTQQAYSIKPSQELVPVTEMAPVHAERVSEPTTTKASSKGRLKTALPMFMTVDMEALPQLGTTVTITLLAITEDGDIAIGFRNGTGNWVTELSGRG